MNSEVEKIFQICEDRTARSGLSRIDLNIEELQSPAFQYLGEYDRPLLAVANAIAIYPCQQPEKPRTPGETFRGIVSDQRFEAWLQSTQDYAIVQFPWWVRFAKQKGRLLDYSTILADFREWDNSEEPQMQWAREFWRSGKG